MVELKCWSHQTFVAAAGAFFAPRPFGFTTGAALSDATTD